MTTAKKFYVIPYMGYNFYDFSFKEWAIISPLPGVLVCRYVFVIIISSLPGVVVCRFSFVSIIPPLLGVVIIQFTRL